jgi:hypothetical protein
MSSAPRYPARTINEGGTHPVGPALAVRYRQLVAEPAMLTVGVAVWTLMAVVAPQRCRRYTPVLEEGPYPRIVDTGWSITQRAAA